MKYFFDTEFCENPCEISLLSIGMVCEDGRTFYAEKSNYELKNCDSWVKMNVLPKLKYIGNQHNTFISYDELNVSMYGTTEDIKKELLKFINCNNPEFWAYYADYDWVVFCWIFGKMIDLPDHFPMYCKDLKQLIDFIGNPKLPKLDPNIEHNALDDALWNKKIYYILQEKLKDLSLNTILKIQGE